MPGPGWYMMGDAEREQVLDVLERRELIRYRYDSTDEAEISKTMQLEKGIGAALGAPYVLAVNSGTSALLCALRAIDIGFGDEVIVPGYTFIASIAAIVYAGATPVLAEVDESLTIDPDDVRRKLSPRTRAIMPVHMIGVPANMDAISAIAVENGLAVVEDVAQACGGSYHGRALGTIGTAGAFSLNVGKTITAGDGGFLVTGERAIYERAFAFHDHGFLPERSGVIDDGPLLGLNLRINELGSALALAQLSRLETILARCRQSKRIVADTFFGLRGARERVVHDLDGECASAYVLIFESSHRATQAASALGGRPLGKSIKHNYALMPQLQRLRKSASSKLPRVRFANPGDLPQTDSILERAVALSIGVVDGYLGTMGGITIIDTPEEVLSKAVDLRARIESVE